MTRDRLLVALLLEDVAKVIGMAEGDELNDLVRAARLSEDDVWPTPLSDRVAKMISLEATRRLMAVKDTAEARAFSVWLDEEFPENAAVSALNEHEGMLENLHRVGEIRQENPNIQTREIAQILKISEDDAQRYVTYHNLLRILK